MMVYKASNLRYIGRYKVALNGCIILAFFQLLGSVLASWWNAKGLIIPSFVLPVLVSLRFYAETASPTSIAWVANATNTIDMLLIPLQVWWCNDVMLLDSAFLAIPCALRMIYGLGCPRASFAIAVCSMQLVLILMEAYLFSADPFDTLGRIMPGLFFSLAGTIVVLSAVRTSDSVETTEIDAAHVELLHDAGHHLKSPSKTETTITDENAFSSVLSSPAEDDSGVQTTSNVSRNDPRTVDRLSSSVEEAANQKNGVCADQHFVEILTKETESSFGAEHHGHYVIQEQLGEGSYGKIFRCCLEKEACNVDTEDDAAVHADGDAKQDEYAVKVIDTRRIALLVDQPLEVVIPRMFQEAQFQFAAGEHPSITKLYKVLFSRKSCRIYLVMELLQGGDLFSALTQNEEEFSEARVRVIMQQLFSAVAFCHSRGIVHRDLRLENCLLRCKFSQSVKICDFGQAKHVGNEVHARTPCTTANYMAPEVKRAVTESKPYDAYSADAYSLGVIMHALLCKHFPTSRNAAHKNGWEMHAFSADACDLIGSLLNDDPGQRLSLPEALAHRWISSYA